MLKYIKQTDNKSFEQSDNTDTRLAIRLEYKVTFLKNRNHIFGVGIAMQTLSFSFQLPFFPNNNNYDRKRTEIIPHIQSDLSKRLNV